MMVSLLIDIRYSQKVKENYFFIFYFSERDIFIVVVEVGVVVVKLGYRSRAEE